jgi:hypothetical protein
VCRFLVYVLLIVACVTEPLFGQFIRGPRGGCYTITASGTKRYVDRSLCGSEPPRGSAAAAGSSRSGLSDAASANDRSKGPEYIRGPKGGCYTLTVSGSKRYVDRSMCEGTPTEPKRRRAAMQ